MSNASHACVSLTRWRCAAAWPASPCSKAETACVRACVTHAVMDGWMEPVVVTWHACTQTTTQWPGRPAVGVRGSGPPSEAEAAVGLTVLSTAPLHRAMHHSVIHCRPRRAGRPASPCARTSPPVPALARPPAAAALGGLPIRHRERPCVEPAGGRPATMHAGRHATPNGRARATHVQDSAATACMPCL